jgi:hypothetical protein
MRNISAYGAKVDNAFAIRGSQTAAPVTKPPQPPQRIFSE